MGAEDIASGNACEFLGFLANIESLKFPYLSFRILPTCLRSAGNDKVCEVGQNCMLRCAGISRSTVTGSRALDETRVGIVAGALGGVVVAFSSLSTTLSAVQIWWFGIAAPAVVAGFAARYYTHLRRSWNEYWSRQEQSRSAVGQMHLSAFRICHQGDESLSCSCRLERHWSVLTVCLILTSC